MEGNSVKKNVRRNYDKPEFSEGASYVVMCYNLYGNDTEPGPKADLENIKFI